MSWEVRVGDCRAVMAAMEPNSISAIVCDPPYGLEFMGRDWDKLNAGKAGRADMMPDGSRNYVHDGRDNVGGRLSRTAAPPTPKKNPRCRVCGRLKFDHAPRKCSCESPDWDTRTAEYGRDMQAWHESWAREAIRVLRPGGFLLAMGGTRTHHRLMCAIEDSGFEIRDAIGHAHAIMVSVTGQGFPKSLNVSADERFCQCLSGVQGTDSPEATEPTAEVLLDEVHGTGPARGPESETMYGLRQDVDAEGQGAGIARQDVLTGLCGEGDKQSAEGDQASAGTNGSVRGLRRDVCDSGISGEPSTEVLQQSMQGQGERQESRHASNRVEGKARLDLGERSQLSPEDERFQQSGVEGWGNLLPQARQLQDDQVRSVPAGIPADGEERRLRDGASADRGEDVRPLSTEARGGASPEPRSARQRTDKLPALPDKQGAQTCGRCGKPVIPPGMGTALKPAIEIIVVARKPLAGTVAETVARWGTGALNIDATRVRTNGADRFGGGANGSGGYHGVDGYERGDGWAAGSSQGRWPPNLLLTHHPDCRPTGATRRVNGITGGKNPVRRDGGAHAPAKGHQTPGRAQTYHDYADPDGTEPVAEWECADGCPVRALDEQAGERRSGGPASGKRYPDQQLGGKHGIYGDLGTGEVFGYQDSGNVSRFFPTFPADPVGDGWYACEDCCIVRHISELTSGCPGCGDTMIPTFPADPPLPIEDAGLVPWRYVPKESRRARNAGLDGMPETARNREDWRRNINTSKQSDGGVRGDIPRANDHPTCKSVALMRWLCRLVTPPGGLILDPFCGSGTTGMAAVLEGFDFVGIEQDEHYAVDLARRRIAHVARYGERWLEAASPKGVTGGRPKHAYAAMKTRCCNVCGSRYKGSGPGAAWPACGHDDWSWVEEMNVESQPKPERDGPAQLVLLTAD